MVRQLRLISGQSLVEVMIAIGLATIVLPAVYLSFMTARQGKAQQLQRVQAAVILQEMSEATRQVRDYDWTTFAVNGVFHPGISGNAWILATGAQTTDGYTRSLTISDAYRDFNAPDSPIVETGGSVDPSTKKVVYTVSWSTPFPADVSSTVYLTRLDNISWIDTSYDQFIAGIQTGVTVNHTGGDPVDGDITLGGGGQGDWCKPNLSIYGFNLNHNASARAVSAIEGRAYAVTGDNNSSETFYDVIISDTNPPTATAAGSTTGQKKAYGVFGDLIYAYIATDTKQEQGTIINLGNHQEIGWLDVQSNSVNGRSITVNPAGTLAYLSATDKKIYIFDISSKTGTKTPIAASPALNGVSYKIVLVGSNLYVAVDASSNQLVILPLAGNGRSFGSAVNISVNGQGAKDIYVKDDGTRAYLATATSATKPEVFIIDSDPASGTYKQTLGSYDTSGMDPYGIAVVTNNKAIVVGAGGVEYQVVDIAGDTITNCSGSLGDFNFNIWGVASVVEEDGDAYSYIITSDGSSEFKIIEGGPTGKVGKSGSFESAIFDAGVSTAFNRLFSTTTIPSGTTLDFQVAVADAVSGSCAAAAFVYQDVDPSGAIPMDNDGTGYENPGRCARYKILFNSNSVGTTPVVYDVTVNYSP
jgi:type II secretory pathway pseudopilin PulG